MHFSAQCPNSFCLSIHDKSEHCEDDKIGPWLLRGAELIAGLLRGSISKPLRPPIPQTGAHNPQSKLVSQIAAKRYQIQRWFILTSYRNVPSNIVLPNSTFVDLVGASFPKRGSRKIKFKTAAKV